MRVLLAIMVFIGFQFHAMSYEIKGELVNQDETIRILEGHTFNAYIRIWPFGNADLDAVRKELEGNDFLDFYYIAKVKNISFSKNNSEVVEIKAKIILKKSYVPRTFYIWPYKGLTVPFEIRNIQPVKNKGSKNYIILEQKIEDGEGAFTLNYTVLLISLSLLAVLIYLLNFFSKKRKIKVREKFELAKWDKIFKDARNRNELEDIFIKRKDWLQIIGGETPPIILFFSILNKIQFKKTWSEMEEHQLYEAFDEMRGIFESN